MLKKGSLLCLVGSLAILGLAACSDDDATCGDGVAKGSEQCDLTDLKQMTCADVVTGSSGTLACNLDCTYNTDGCALCGDGVRNFGEQCDCGTDANNLPTGCMDVNGGTDANCSDTCEKISVCGDGTVDSDEDCDCGTDADNLPTGCPDVNGGTDANCDADCNDIVECSQSDYMGDCNPLTTGDCCPDEWGNDIECTSLPSGSDICLGTCSETADCYWGNFCYADAGDVCFPEYCSNDPTAGWPNTTVNGPCTVTGGGDGYCWPIISRSDPDDYDWGLCVESGSLTTGQTCPAYPVSGPDRSVDVCQNGFCASQTGDTEGTCYRFCDWEKRYASAIYNETPTNDTLGDCPSGYNCFAEATMDLTTGVRSGDLAYCAPTPATDADAGFDTCSLVTGQLIKTPGTHCSDSSDYSNGRCVWVQYSGGEETQGALIGVCIDGDVQTKDLWEQCDDTTDICPPQSLCLAENVFGDADGTKRCLPMCDTEHPTQTPAEECADLLSSVSTGSATTLCQSYSLLAGPDGAADREKTRLGFCALP